MVFKSIGHNLANLPRVSGRESRALFWPYAIAVFLFGMVLSVALMIPFMTDMMERMQAYLAAHPEGFPEPVPGQNPFPPEAMPDFGKMVMPIVVVTVVTYLLWFSAVVRRLHDRGRSGWWGAIVLPFQFIGLAISPRLFHEMTLFPAKPGGLMMLSTLNSLCLWGAFIFLVIQLAQVGSPGPNRYGDPVTG